MLLAGLSGHQKTDNGSVFSQCNWEGGVRVTLLDVQFKRQVDQINDYF